MSTQAETPFRCRNCDAEAPGRFCAACGQPTRLPPPTVAALVGKGLRDFLKVDGKTLATLRALFTRPGFLTREYWEGHRVRYTEPRRLYLFASLVFFGGYSLFAGTPFVDIKVDDPGKTAVITEQSPWLVRRGDALAKMPRAQLVANVRAAIVSTMPKISFALLPFFALLTWVVFRAARRRYLEHVTFAFHVHSFAFLALVPGFLGKYVQLVCLGAIGVYFFWSMSRAYGLSFGRTLWRYLVINAVYSFVMLLALTTLVFWKA